MLKNLELAKWIHHSKGKTDDSLEEGRCFEWRGKDMGEARICPEKDGQLGVMSDTGWRRARY